MPRMRTGLLPLLTNPTVSAWSPVPECVSTETLVRRPKFFGSTVVRVTGSESVQTPFTEARTTNVSVPKALPRRDGPTAPVTRVLFLNHW